MPAHQAGISRGGAGNLPRTTSSPVSPAPCFLLLHLGQLCRESIRYFADLQRAPLALPCYAGLKRNNVSKQVVNASIRHELLSGLVIEDPQRLIAIPEERAM